eukprot:CAMPEP_0115877238 /NCGR_PEP_ID=MMETSP0287-20121206/26110_1 /TAXON_ID=412157 /ORGANISM="Chrysochromulina rotalis, Strain UIO044" /LENGTH=92 /DNA_ID=CAMNT_0003332727 /DNA_START=156 /DNA_END=430 /DNA_ORIENTATION=+
MSPRSAASPLRSSLKGPPLLCAMANCDPHPHQVWCHRATSSSMTTTPPTSLSAVEPTGRVTAGPRGAGDGAPRLATRSRASVASSSFMSDVS